MISIVICSVNPDALAIIKKNIDETVGIPYEIIIIENTGNRYGICKAYNEGGMTARFPFICFMHEDICFETVNWGLLVCKHLKDKQTGIIGIAGGDAKSLVPSSWSIPIISNEINVVQHYKRNPKPPEHIVITGAGIDMCKKKVVALDGVWLCTRKDVFDEFKFDEKNLPGFHGYDIDYSLQLYKKYNAYVIFDIVIHHYSEGNPDKNWINSAMIISEKWKKQLPVAASSFSKAVYRQQHWHSMQVLMQKLTQLNYSCWYILAVFLQYSSNRFFTPRRFFSMAKYVLLQLYQRNHINVLQANRRL